MIITIGIGFVSSRRKKSVDMDEYFVSKHRLPPLVLAFSAVATTLSGSPFLGVPGNVFRYGYGMWVAGCAVGGVGGTILANLVLGKPLRKYSESRPATTIVEILEGIFKDKRLRYIAIPTILFGSIYFAVVNWVAIGNLLNGLLGIEYKTAVIIGLVIVILYSVLGGNNATAAVSVAQVFIAIFASLYLAFVALSVSGGFTQLNLSVAQYSPGHLKVVFGNFPTNLFISYTLLYTFGNLGQPHCAIKYVQIKDAKTYPKALMFSMISHISTIVFVPLVGLTMFVQVNQGAIDPITATDTVTPLFISYFSHPAIAGLLVAATLSAIMSTGVALILTASSTVVKDIMNNMLHINCEGKKGVRYGQIAMMVCMIISGYLSLDPASDLVTLGAAAWGIFAAVFTAPLILGLRWRRVSREGAFAAMLISAVLVVGCNILSITGIWSWPFKLDLGVTAMFLNAIIMVGVSLFYKPAERDFLPTPKSELVKIAAQRIMQ
jgi:SSS family transporter